MEKERLRFSVHDDIVLLREVLRANPFINTQVWAELTPRVHEQTGKCFTVRAIKDHVKLLMEFWMNGDVHKLRRRGTEEDRALKEQLLEQVMQLRGCYRAKTEVALANIGIKIKPEIETDNQENINSPVCMEVPVEVEDVLMNGADETEASDNSESNCVKTDVSLSVNGSGTKIDAEPDDRTMNTGILKSTSRDFPGLIQAKQQSDDTRTTLASALPFPTTPATTRQFTRSLAIVTSPHNSSGIKQRHHQRQALKKNQGFGRDRVLRFLERKSRRETALERAKLRLKERELKLKEDQLALDREKFQLEKMEREDRIQGERLKNQLFAEQQQLIIDMLKEKSCGPS